MKHNEVITIKGGKRYRLDVKSEIKSGPMSDVVIKIDKGDDLYWVNQNYAKAKEIISKSKKTKKFAKLVTFEVTVRVVVERHIEMSDSELDDLAIKQASSKAVEALRSGADGLENVSAVVDDTECPFGTFDEDKE